jgi:hypothetical protein
LYYLAWVNNAEHFEASTKYLALADKAAQLTSTPFVRGSTIIETKAEPLMV